MLKPSYGPKDAPRSWRKKLHQAFTKWMSCQQLYAEFESYCVHDDNQKDSGNAIVRAKEHDQEQQELGNTRKVPAQQHKLGNLRCMCSMHVDDTKGTATQETANLRLAHLTDKVGQCKADYGSSLHTGIRHEHSLGIVHAHQHVYIDSITPIGSSMLSCKDDEALCDIM